MGNCVQQWVTHVFDSNKWNWTLRSATLCSERPRSRRKFQFCQCQPFRRPPNWSKFPEIDEANTALVKREKECTFATIHQRPKSPYILFGFLACVLRLPSRVFTNFARLLSLCHAFCSVVCGAPPQLLHLSPDHAILSYCRGWNF